MAGNAERVAWGVNDGVERSLEMGWRGSDPWGKFLTDFWAEFPQLNFCADPHTTNPSSVSKKICIIGERKEKQKKRPTRENFVEQVRRHNAQKRAQHRPPRPPLPPRTTPSRTRPRPPPARARTHPPSCSCSRWKGGWGRNIRHLKPLLNPSTHRTASMWRMSSKRKRSWSSAELVA